MVICNSRECSGCGLCSVVCPKGAILMNNDEYGFMHPVIDLNKCINCGLCKKKCPSVNIVKGQINNTAYAAYSKEDQIHKTCQSGGLAYLLSKYAIDTGGIVYGQAFNNKLEVSWLRVDTLELLSKLKMSKYVQGRVEGAFKSVIKDLKDGRRVFFTGTPCQIAAVLSFVPDILKENLITISFVCGGVASVQNLHDQLDYLHHKKKIDKACIDNITFRKKGGGYYFRFYSNGRVIYEEDDFFSDFLIAYGKHLNLRESCYKCKYARIDRIGDITIGDYLALDRYETKLSKTKLKDGVSLAIPTSDKGKTILQIVLNSMEYEKRTSEDASLNNRRLSIPSERSKEVDVYRKLYLKYGFRKSVHKIYWKKYYWLGYWKHRIGIVVRKALGTLNSN